MHQPRAYYEPSKTRADAGIMRTMRLLCMGRSLRGKRRMLRSVYWGH